jgi:hypothetical protein
MTFRTAVLAMIWTLTFGTPVLLAQELSGPMAGPTDAVVPRAVQSPDRALAPGAETDATQDNGRLPITLGATLAGYYDDNIYIQPGSVGRTGDFIYDVVPFVSYNSARNTGVDNSVQITYAPGFVFYLNHSGNDTFEQNGSFVYGYHGSRCDLIVSQQYASVQNSAPDEGDLVKVHEYETVLNFDYTIGAKLSATVRAQQDINDYDQGFSSTQWSGSVYLNYEIMPKTTVGLGVVGGAADLEGPNQTFEQVNGRVVYTPTEKLSFNATAGGELRQTQGYSESTLTPVFSGGFSYVPWDDTSVTINAYRAYNYSAKYFGQDYLATGASFSFTQGFRQKLWATLSGSYENAHYEDNLADESNDIDYNYFTVRVALDYQANDWWSFGAYYQYRRNISAEINGFVDDQVGCQVRFTY